VAIDAILALGTIGGHEAALRHADGALGIRRRGRTCQSARTEVILRIALAPLVEQADTFKYGAVLHDRVAAETRRTALFQLAGHTQDLVAQWMGHGLVDFQTTCEATGREERHTDKHYF